MERVTFHYFYGKQLKCIFHLFTDKIIRGQKTVGLTNPCDYFLKLVVRKSKGENRYCKKITII